MLLNNSLLSIIFLSTLPNIFIFIIILIFSLNSTLIIASLTLVERKVLSIVQRRVGPNYVGYRGRLQYIADALKLLLKGISVPNFSNKKLFLIIPCFSLIICYTFWWNSIWGPNLSLIEIEYNLVYLGIMSIFFSFCIINISVFSKNKYSILSAVRSVAIVINLEIFLSFFFLFVVSYSESFSFSAIINNQVNNNYYIFCILPLIPILIITFLLETGRAPFDLLEAESELIAGYSNELAGFFFALFYLAEYFHLFFFSLAISCIFFGGFV